MNKFPEPNDKINLRSLDSLHRWSNRPLREVRYDIEDCMAVASARGETPFPGLGQLVELGRRWIARSKNLPLRSIALEHAEGLIDRASIQRYERAPRTECGGLLC